MIGSVNGAGRNLLLLVFISTLVLRKRLLEAPMLVTDMLKVVLT